MNYYLAATFFLITGVATAQSLPTKGGPFNGTVSIVDNEASFEVEFQGNSTSILSLSVMGPRVAGVTVKATRIVPKRAGSSVKPWTFALTEAQRMRKRVERRGCIPAAVELPEEDPLPTFEELGLSPDLYQRLYLLLLTVKNELDTAPDTPMTERCGVVSLETKALIESTLVEAIATSGIQNATWTPEDTCLLLNTRALEDAYRYFGITADMTLPGSAVARSIPGPANRLALSNYIGILRKDACDPSGNKLRYKVRVTIRFRRDTTTGTARVTLSEQTYSGYRGTSLKPESEGRFAPQPILLMSSLTSCFQELSFVSWKQGRPTVKKLQLEDTITYRGASYDRVPIGNLLKGGRGVFDIENGQSSYGVCLALSATRQVVNGYPLPGGS